MRALRILAASVWYFVCTAVNNREPLFWSQLERARFMRVLNEARKRYVFELRGLRFCGPWVSFYIKPADGLQLPEIMQWIKQTYAVRYNVYDGRTGHIWGDRYWSKVLEGEPPEEEVPVSGTECGDCAGRAGEGRPAVEADGQIPEARLERGPPDGDSHRAGNTGENTRSPPVLPRNTAP
ncbi:MAG: transposase [Spirochaetaceae bacterium]|jgi:REP element-mobilizing transposase RayT|nr:transposase [Spirochaetaceae bacterium]